MSRSRRLVALVLAAGRATAALLPPGVRRALDDRFFYAVFNVTRVTNDAYGWRPDEADQPEAEAPAAQAPAAEGAADEEPAG